MPHPHARLASTFVLHGNFRYLYLDVEQNPPGRRPHYHRGRRGPDRRGPDRRAAQLPDQGATRPGGDAVDVEQIMRDIRTRIAQRHGIELSNQQIQELAARRLEAILDPRNINPRLMEQLRRGAGATADVTPAAASDPGYAFEETTLYDSHRSVLRFIRKLLNPILKLFFNPTPLAHALQTQARLNREAAAREAERERVQAEWNALHYDILQRLVTEVSRASIDMQSLALRVESLSARVDFNDRRVRAFENVPPGRAPSRAAEPAPVAAPTPAANGAAVVEAATPTAAAEGTRRRRRRRRGRRGGTAEAEGAVGAAAGGEDLAGGEGTDSDEGDDEVAAGSGVAEAPDMAATSDAEQAPTAAAEPAAPPPAPAPADLPAAEAAPASDRPAPPPQLPTPPPDEPVPQAPVDQPDPGPPDR